MKKIYAFLIILSACYSGNAQNQVLFEHEWLLDFIVVNGETHTPPGNWETRELPLRFTPGNESSYAFVLFNMCNGAGAVTNFSTTESSFFVDGWAITLGSCSLPENNAYENLYFMDLLTSNTPGNFLYDVSYLDNQATLTVMGANGNYGVYHSRLLATDRFDDAQFSIYPNPVSDFIKITSGSKGLENATVEIYDALGKLCRSAILSGQQINVQNFEKGIYFVKVRNGDLSSTKKFIKI